MTDRNSKRKTDKIDIPFQFAKETKNTRVNESLMYENHVWNYGDRSMTAPKNFFPKRQNKFCARAFLTNIGIKILPLRLGLQVLF